MPRQRCGTIAHGNPRGNLSYEGRLSVHACGALQGAACLGNWPNFCGRVSTPPENTTFPPDHNNKKHCILNMQESSRLMLPSTIPTVVLLLQLTDISNWGWPSSSRVRWWARPLHIFKKSISSSTSAADVATNLRMADRMWKLLLRRMDRPSSRLHPRKKIS